MEQTHTIEPAHVAAGIGAGIVSRALGVLAVGKGWIGPKLTAGLMAGGGLAAIGAGLASQSVWMTAAGAGLAASGILSFVTQAAIGLYEAIDGDQEQESKRQLSPQTDGDGTSAAQAEEPAQEQADTEARAKRSPRNAAKRARKRQKKHKTKKGAKHRNAHRPTEEKAAEAIDDDPDRASIPAG